MKEIVTIQVGPFANFIGSHYWNFQDELLGLAEDPNGHPFFKNSCLNMDVLYRVGETEMGTPTYNPRLLSVGFQGSLGSLGHSGSMNNSVGTSDSTNIFTWNGNVSKFIAEPFEKNLFLQSLHEEAHQNTVLSGDKASEEMQDSWKEINDKDRVECLESCVKFWTDYSKVQYHPRGLYEIHGLWTDMDKFDNFGVGKDILSGGLELEEITERLRFFVEECDHIQGIQFIVDDSGGFSSIATEVLENIADEYTNTPVLLYAARDPSAYSYAVNLKSTTTRALHDAVSFARLSSYCHLMVPVGLPSLSSSLSPLLHVEDQKVFHCGAIYAASIHAMSMPFRMQIPGPADNSGYDSGAVDIGEMVQILSCQARQNFVSALDVAMPLPSLTDKLAQETILRYLHSLTPETNNNDDDLYAVESLVFQGTLHSGDNRATVSQVKDILHTAYQSQPTKPMFSHLSVASSPLPIPLPFPSIFGSSIGIHGELLQTPNEEGKPRGPLEVESIPMAARLRSSRAIMPYIQNRLMNLRKYGISRAASGAELLRSWGFGNDEVEDMGEHLAKLMQALDPHSQSSSDSD